MNSSTTWPSLKALTAGIDWISNAWETSGLASVSTLASSTLPSRACDGLLEHGRAGGRGRTTRPRSRRRPGAHGALDDVSLEGGVGDVDGHACEDSPPWNSGPTRTASARGRGGRGRRAGRPAARPDRHAPLRRHGLAGARARRPPRRRLRRARPRAVRRASRGDYGYSASPTTCSPSSTTAGSRGRARPAPRWAPTRSRRSRSTTPTASRGLVIITPAYDPDRRRPALERWDRLADGLRDGGVDGFVAAYGDPRTCPRGGSTRSTACCTSGSPRTTHPDALADALQAVPRSRPFEALGGAGAIAAPTTSSPAATRSTPSTRTRSASATPRRSRRRRSSPRRRATPRWPGRARSSRR